MDVIVHNNDLDRALRDLKRQVQREGLMRELNGALPMRNRR